MMAMIPIAPIVYDFSLPFRVGMCRMVGLGDQRMRRSRHNWITISLFLLTVPGPLRPSLPAMPRITPSLLSFFLFLSLGKRRRGGISQAFRSNLR